jgi:type I restriction enzyme R subunit
MPMTEADTWRKFVVPLLQKAGWDSDPHSIVEQRHFTAGPSRLSGAPRSNSRCSKRSAKLYVGSARSALPQSQVKASPKPLPSSTPFSPPPSTAPSKENFNYDH